MKKKTRNLSIVCFWILLVYVVLAIFKLLVFDALIYRVPDFIQPLADVTVNLALKEKPDKAPIMCFDTNCYKMYKSANSKVYNFSYSKRDLALKYPNQIIRNYQLVYFSNNSKLEDNFSDFYLYMNDRKYHFDKISELEKVTLPLNIEKSAQNYEVFKLPKSIPSNYNGTSAKILSFVFSLLYYWWGFLHIWISVFIGFTIYYFNKDKFNFKFKPISKKVQFGLILALCVFLRLFYIFKFRLYSPDELYTINFAAKSFLSCFQDPGNPPLFYILEFFALKLSNSVFITRLFPLIFSISFVLAVYKLFLKISEKLALFMMFFASINIIGIIYSNVARTYSLSMLLSILMVYFLFEYLEKKDNRNLILYSITAALSLNTHFLLGFVVISNFIWGVLKLLKDRKNLAKFILSNTIAAITIFPYIIACANSSLADSFNRWIDPLNLKTINQIISIWFLNKFFFLVVLVISLIYLCFSFMPQKSFEKLNFKINPLKKELFLYLTFTLFINIAIQAFISLNIKPIMHFRILSALYGLLFIYEGILIATIFDFDLKTKLAKYYKQLYTIFAVLLFLLITKSPYGGFVRSENFEYFVNEDIKKYSIENYDRHVLITEGLYGVFDKENVDVHFKKNQTLHTEKIDYPKNDKKLVVYTSNLSAKIYSLAKDERFDVYFFENLDGGVFVKMISK